MELFQQIKLFNSLSLDNQNALTQLASQFPFSFQQRKMLCDFVADFSTWGEGLPWEQVDDWVWSKVRELPNKQNVNALFSEIEKHYWAIQGDETKNYDHFIADPGNCVQPSAEFIEPEGVIMGRCPVSSDKTRCCQLYTLDAVWQCGFDCSYCSIQSFYSNNKVRFVKDFKKRLSEIPIDPNQRYHIGTGQSSDSLMWGNAYGLLDDLCDFADEHPNIILEMKSKSCATSYFEERVASGKKIPKNMLFTWSLNSPIVAEKEERGAATIEKRLFAARTMANLGAPVGFHFHPMVMYDNWKGDYRDLVTQVTSLFRPTEVMTISIGTLTYIKPVVKQIRARQAKTRILQMPMQEIAGKISYPYEKKVEMFSWLYQSFPQRWRDNNFFYLCMEDPKLWMDVFGHEYPNNDAFEQAMLDHYFEFIK